MRHGFRAEKLALPGEDAPLLEAEFRRWFDAYQPMTPVEGELIERMVIASFQRKRIDIARTAIVAEQMRCAEFLIVKAFDDRLPVLKAVIDEQAATVVQELRGSAAGCRWMISRWERLLEVLHQDGTWLGDDRNEAIQLQGFPAFTDLLCHSEQAYLTFMYSYISQKNHHKKYLKLLLSKFRIPDTLRARGRASWMPKAEDCKAWLEALAHAQLDELRKREEYLRTTMEEPSRAEAMLRAMVPAGKPGQDLARYDRMQESSFHKAYEALRKGRLELARTGILPAMADELYREGGDEEPAPSAEPASPAPAAYQKLPASYGDACPDARLSGALENAPNEASGARVTAVDGCGATGCGHQSSRVNAGEAARSEAPAAAEGADEAQGASA